MKTIKKCGSGRNDKIKFEDKRAPIAEEIVLSMMTCSMLFLKGTFKYIICV